MSDSIFYFLNGSPSRKGQRPMPCRRIVEIARSRHVVGRSRASRLATRPTSPFTFTLTLTYHTPIYTSANKFTTAYHTMTSRAKRAIAPVRFASNTCTDAGIEENDLDDGGDDK